MKEIALRAQIPEFATLDIDARAKRIAASREGQCATSLSGGEPDYLPPPAAAVGPPFGARGFVRLSFADLIEGIQRLKRFLRA